MDSLPLLFVKSVFCLGANDFIEFDNAMEPPTNDRFKVRWLFTSLMILTWYLRDNSTLLHVGVLKECHYIYIMFIDLQVGLHINL